MVLRSTKDPVRLWWLGSTEPLASNTDHRRVAFAGMVCSNLRSAQRPSATFEAPDPQPMSDDVHAAVNGAARRTSSTNQKSQQVPEPLV